MIVYNITTKVHHSIDAAWLKWQQQEQIPAMMATKAFTNFTICRLLEQDDSEGKTYAIQFTAVNHQAYQQYIDTHATAMRSKALLKWGDRILSFHSVMEVIQ